MGSHHKNGQLFDLGVSLIRDHYHRSSEWASNQLSQALRLANTQNLTPVTMREIMKYDFGIEWNNDQKV